MKYFTKEWKWRYTNATFKILKFEKFRNGFPFWHIETYLKKFFKINIQLRVPFFPDNLHWILQAEK